MNREILESLDLVGRAKVVGYLPLRTISDVLDIHLNDLKRRYKARSLNVRVFSEKYTCIKSGAFFVYDNIMLENNIRQFEKTLSSLDWSPVPVHIIRRIARNWYNADHPIMPFIRSLYGEAL